MAEIYGNYISEHNQGGQVQQEQGCRQLEMEELPLGGVKSGMVDQ
jgi:hypothetical protein|tara:strand:+ start:542 stop:676 length:135 start_codon:yes stop_codon:yes gene_type:complete